MTKRYATLQKKLQELQSELIEVFGLTAGTPLHQVFFDDIEQRFAFLKNLLSAEVASHPSKPHHLHHIAERVTELESAFREWDEYRISAVNNHFDTGSICSCTDSCPNDDELNLELNDISDTFYESTVDEKAIEETAKIEVERKEKKEERMDWLETYCFVMGSGMIVGAVLMGFVMVKFYGCFHFVQHYDGFLFPT